MTQLFPHFPFDPIETPQSFASRLAWLHTQGALVPFLKDIGIKPAELISSEAHTIDVLAKIAGVDALSLQGNTGVRVGKRRYNLRGSHVSAEFMARPATTYCAACLADDDALFGEPGLRRGRWIWTLAAVRTCPEHGLPLLVQEKEKWDDDLHVMTDRVPKHEQDLRDIAAKLQVRTVSPLQSYITARLSGVAGPEWLDAQGLEQVWRTTEMLGMVLLCGPDKNLKTATRDEWDNAGREGFKYTSRGEQGVREALQCIFQARPRLAKNEGPQKVFGRLFQWLAFAKGAKEPGRIKDIMRTFIFEHFALPAGHAVFGTALPQRRLHTAPSLAKEVGVDVRTLRNLLIAKRLVPAGNENAHVAFDAAAGRSVANSMVRLVAGIALPKVLNSSRPQAEQLLDEGLLTPIVDEFVEGHGRVQKACDAMQIEGFLECLHDAAQSVPIISDDLVSVSKAAERAKISSGEIVHLILGYHLQTVVRKQGQRGVSSIFVDADEVKGAVRILGNRLSISAVSAALKMPRHSVVKLASTRPDLLPTMIIEPRVGSHQIPRFCEGDVQKFRESFTSATRVANKQGVELKVTLGAFKRAGVKPVFRHSDIGIDLYRTRDIPERMLI